MKKLGCIVIALLIALLAFFAITQQVPAAESALESATGTAIMAGLVGTDCLVLEMRQLDYGTILYGLNTNNCPNPISRCATQNGGTGVSVICWLGDWRMNIGYKVS